MTSRFFRRDGTPCDEAEATFNGMLRDGYRTTLNVALRDGAPLGGNRMSFTSTAAIVDASSVTGHINDSQFLDAVRRCEDARTAMIDRYNQSGARHPSKAAPTPVTQETAPVITHDQNTTAQQREAAAHAAMVANYNRK